MPRQSRGFWVCTQCEVAFDEYEEAINHEATCGKPRVYSFLGTNEGLELTQSDRIAGGYLQFVEVSHRVGLRCSLCHDVSAFPGSISEIPHCFREMQNHLIRCPHADRLIASELRQIVSASSRTGGDGARVGEHKEDFQHLLSFIQERCSQLSIVSRGGKLVFVSETDDKPLPLNAAVGPLSLDTGTIDFEEEDDSIDPLVGEFSSHSAVLNSRQQDRLTSGEVEDIPMERYVPVYDIPANFPFFQEPSGRWMCKYCYHLPPHHRQEHFWWHLPDGTPPPVDLIDRHMAICRAYISAMQRHQYMLSRASFEHEQAQHHPMIHPTVDTRMSNFEPPRPSSQVNQTQRQQQAPARHRKNPKAGNSKVDAKYEKAIQYLAQHDLSMLDDDRRPLPESCRLVVEEDKLLLTDYLFYLMKQLRLVRFSEKDRRTRGGKRESIQVGYGGLQCVHCTDLPNSRKFFWSNVDRLSNSFAEIPAHILKCKGCPQPVHDALILLKQKHPEQMSEVPRGSQKVFFRRVWRRLHSNDPVLSDAHQATTPLQVVSSSIEPRVVTSEVGAFVPSSGHRWLLERHPSESAQILKFMDTSLQMPLSSDSRVVLATYQDDEYLTREECLLRQNTEVFVCSAFDRDRFQGQNMPKLSQVGLRCLHCALSNNSNVFTLYPSSINDLHDCVRGPISKHLIDCEHTEGVKEVVDQNRGAPSLARRYYVLSAKALGLQDGPQEGVIAGAEPQPITPRAAYVFSDKSEEYSQGNSKESSGIFSLGQAKRSQSSPNVVSKRVRL